MKDNRTRIVLWDPEGETEPCILDEWQSMELRNAKFSLEASGNYAAGYNSKFALDANGNYQAKICDKSSNYEWRHKISVWDLRKGETYSSYYVPADDYWREKEFWKVEHQISPDGRWLAIMSEVTDKMIPATLVGDLYDFYCIHEDGSVSHEKPNNEEPGFKTFCYLFDLRRGGIPRILCTSRHIKLMIDTKQAMFSPENKLLFQLRYSHDGVHDVIVDVIVIDPASLLSEKRCPAEIPLQPPRKYELDERALSPDREILVRRFKPEFDVNSYYDFYGADRTDLKNKAKLQFIHVPAGRCRTTLDVINERSFFITGDGKGVLFPMIKFSCRREPFIYAVPQWIYSAPMMPSFTASIMSTGMAFETEREYEELLQAGERYFDRGRLTEALACVDRAWSLREPERRLIALNRRLGQTCVAVGIRSLRKVGSFPYYLDRNVCNMKETPLFSRDGTCFVTRTGYERWQKFDAQTLLPLSPEFEFKIESSDMYTAGANYHSSALSPDTRFLYVEYVDLNDVYGIKKFDLVTGQTTEVFAAHPSYGAPLLSPEGDILFCNSHSECLAFSTSTYSLIFNMEIPEGALDKEFEVMGAPGDTQKLLSSDGKKMYCAAYLGPVWAYALNGAPSKLFEADHKEAPQRTIECALSPDDKWLCILREDGKIELLDAENGELLHIFTSWEQTPIQEPIPSLAFSPDGNLLLLFLEKSISIFDLKNRAVCGTYPMYDWIGNAVFAPDGRLFAISPVCGGTVYEVDFIYRAPEDFPE